MLDGSRYNEGRKLMTREANICADALKEAGVDILLYTTFCDVVMDGNRVIGIICHNKSGFCKYDAKVVIDASGDGDVAEKSGAEYYKGRESDGKMQPATLMFKIGGVDTERAVFPGSFETLVKTDKGELQALAREKLPHPAGHVLLYRSTIIGICFLQTISAFVRSSAAVPSISVTFVILQVTIPGSVER